MAAPCLFSRRGIHVPISPMNATGNVKAMPQARLDRQAAAREWDFGGVDYMNHGSYGACPRRVQDFVQQQRLALMRNPIEYYTCETPKNNLENRKFWTEFTRADLEGVVHIECATLAVSTVLK